ncbi:MAG TPA: hypothetical protein V6D09_07170 [Leptolyngbyaceae cyanobacterium]
MRLVPAFEAHPSTAVMTGLLMQCLQILALGACQSPRHDGQHSSYAKKFFQNLNPFTVGG